MSAALALGLLGVSGAASAGAESAKLDAAMRPVVERYLAIGVTLAADSDKGVQAAAKALGKAAAGLDAGAVKGPAAKQYAELVKKLKAAAPKLVAASGLEARRAAFKELSRPLVLWATLSKPKDLNVVYCSMAKGSWLQKEKAIANPYYGSKMLRCGEVVSGPAKGAADGHMKH
jgi:hypothetical protein